MRRAVVLDACVLVPRGLRDVLLSCADQGLFRPIWQDQIADEVRKNQARLLVRSGTDEDIARDMVERGLKQMDAAFPDANLDAEIWVPEVANMTNHPKDRHVLAAAVAGHATHVVTSNMKDFPVRSRPPGVAVLRPDAFLLELASEDPEGVVNAMRAKVARHKKPPHTLEELADALAGGERAPRFGRQLQALVATT